MNEVQSLLDGLQSALNSSQSLWNQVSGLMGNIFGGNDTVGSIVLAIIGLAIAGAVAFFARSLFEN